MNNKKTASIFMILGGFLVFLKYLSKYFIAAEKEVGAHWSYVIVMVCALVIAAIGIISLRNINLKSKSN